MKRVAKLLLPLVFMFFANMSAFASVAIKTVEAHQRYPWNGLVDIAVTFEGSAEDVAKVDCSFEAMNSATYRSVPIKSVVWNGSDAGFGTNWTRRFIWNATKDVGDVVIDDLKITVNANDEKVLGGVQLWKNGPYWAECNVGASKPEDYGYYFWWGDTVGYKRDVYNNGWISVKSGAKFSFDSEGCSAYYRSVEYIDSSASLTNRFLPEYDAATAHHGAPWRVPTDDEFILIEFNCSTKWTTRNGVYGRLITGTGAYASKSIFLPAAGHGDYLLLSDAGSHGCYWSSRPEGDLYAWYHDFDSSGCHRYGYLLYFGLSIRPLRECSNNVVTTHLKVDCRSGTRATSTSGEMLNYDKRWYENCSSVRLLLGSTQLTVGTAGTYTWVPAICGTHTLTLQALNNSGSVVATETVSMELNHDEVLSMTAKEATCTESGWTKGAHCSRCNSVLATSEPLTALGHVEVVTRAACGATCTEAGYTKGSKCSRCNAVLAISEPVAALGHVEVVTRAACEATCTEAGHTKGSKCSRCNAVLSVSEETSPALGHSEVITKAAVEPTDSTTGMTAEICCSRCNQLLQASEVITSLGDHCRIRDVTAHQRYPWNGLVDIAVTFEGSAEDVDGAICIFAATNCENGTTIPVASIARNGADTGSDTTWMRRFVWNVTNDIGAAKIDDLALSVGVKVLGGVQLWKDGPYWAECNVGASQPEDYGYYFWWGDTSGCKRNSNDNGWISTWNYVGFLFCPENCPTHNKNTWQLEEDGYIASTYNLMSVYDAATVRLGAPWRMPTYAEYTALISNCNASWTVRNGVNGMLISGKDNYASKNIFLPATGDGGGSKRYSEGSAAFYWSSTPINDTWPIYCTTTWSLCCEGGRLGVIKGPRYAGQPVRPIRGFSDGEGPGVVVNGVTTHLKLDCRTGVRECSAEGEELRYDVAWYENGTEARIAEDGAVVMTGTAGEYTWHPIPSCSTRHVTFNLEVRSGEQIVGDETAEFTCPATLAHTGIVTKEAVEPTSITPGSTAEIRCSQCNELMQASAAIPALGLYVRHVTAKQRYPWNGLVDVVVTLEGASNDVAQSGCIFSVTNCTTGAAVPVVNITQNGSDIGSSATWTRRYVWDAMADVGSVKIDNLSLTVGVNAAGGVRLWEDGPYWSECNVGATKPEEYGYYFAWGDTVGYKRNESNDGWVSVKDGSSHSFVSNNCPTSSKDWSQLQTMGCIDSTGNLVAEHDAATAFLGAPWHMPADDEYAALISNCTATWAVRNGVPGLLVAGKGSFAKKCIFLPAAGDGYDSGHRQESSNGNYWSATPQSGTLEAWCLAFNSTEFRRGYNWRSDGRPVRPIRENQQMGTRAMTTHLKLDCRTGVRECSTDGEQLFYDASWYENGTEARIIENDAIIATGAAGVYIWHPNLSPCCSTHTLRLEVRAGEQVVGTETAVFKSAATQEHSEVVTAVARAATCTEVGCTKGAYCSRCNAVLSTSTVLPALGHVEVVTSAARAATCTEAGCTKRSYCSRCNAVLSTSTILPALCHSEVVTKEPVEPTSAAPGSTAEIRCSRCNEMLQTSELIPALGYIRDVAARQLWPHNKVALSFGVADDISEITDTNDDLSVWCVRGIETNVATQILGDRSARPGHHHVIWDMEAEGLKLPNGETDFGVSVAEKTLGGVQLWEDGPFWAECNVGATKPEECGYYFWWGDTVGYKRNADNNGWVSVKDGSSFHFYSGNCPTYGKNNSQLKSAGYIDSTGNLVAAHDAATAHLGAPWRMSTDAEFAALISNCTTTWTHRNGVYGHLVTGKGDYSSKSIFLPAAGSGLDAYLHYTEFGSSWSSTPSSSFSSSAILLYFGSGDFTRYDGGRFNGSPVRPLRTSSK